MKPYMKLNKKGQEESKWVMKLILIMATLLVMFLIYMAIKGVLSDMLKKI